ncbi:PREDICTED: nicotinamide phosphoribosyltransferase-like [Acropora digitifera]|uniref:nicotinamide phosphoribosyltransferase-like n=1 Tax=Acropora digitifera TaxID=70779 RepID=UPI00077A4291|nr:PREDICTED: nicotinamide phosphoribosyltransferase-like [Acropora digitifera]
MAEILDPENILLITDSYKVSHHKQYPPGTSILFSYFESRGGKFPEVCFFGLQYLIKRWLVGQVVTAEKIRQAKDFYQLHFGYNLFNEEGWLHILEKHGGKLPLRIRAVPEGSVVPVKNVLFTVQNTDPDCPWLTNWVETLLVQCWYPMTVATNSRAQKKIIAEFLSETADNLNGLPFKLHDFGFRGSTSVEAASLGGAAHLVNFLGSDTVAGMILARNYYGCEIAGFSIPAAEHSTITTWGRHGESKAFRNMLEQFPSGRVACVSDSYNICTNYAASCLCFAGEKFGCEKNSKGFYMLPPYLRIIQGDGISYETLTEILESMKRHKWSADNIAFGSGGALLQKIDRDTQKCAYKCCFAVINDNPVNVYKQPITDAAKHSKKGLLSLEVDEEGRYVTVEEGRGNADKDLLQTVFEDGVLVKEYTFAEVRENAEIPLVKASKQNGLK